MSLADRLKKNSKIKDTALIGKSKIFNQKDMIPTQVPMINVALSGDMFGGFQAGLTMWAGPSKHFKTMFTLVCAKAFQDKHPDGVILWYDSEFGSPPDYFESAGIDLERVVHTPVTDIEELKEDISNQLRGIERGDHVCICIDSVGNLASRKEVDDAIDGKNVVDMTRAKQLKSLFRIVTPHLTTKNIPMFVVNHTYKTLEMYSKDVVGGGTGSMYSSDNVYIIGRRQEKEGKELLGYDFVIKVEKSRFVKEGSQIPISVRFEGGIIQWSGLLDVALAGGYVIKPSNGWFQRSNPKTGEVLEEEKHRRAQTNSKEFWELVLEKTDFADYVKSVYKLSVGALITDDTSTEPEVMTFDDEEEVNFDEVSES